MKGKIAWMLGWLALPVMLLACAVTHGQTVYRCVAGDGSVSYQDQACPRQSRLSRVVDIPPTAPVIAETRTAPASSHTRAAPRRRVATPQRKEVQSHECRTATGLVFYRHSRCPSSVVDRSAVRGHARTVPVTGRSMNRSEACRRMRNIARDGEELDEKASTYDRNLGRDTCRDY